MTHDAAERAAAHIALALALDPESRHGPGASFVARASVHSKKVYPSTCWPRNGRFMPPPNGLRQSSAFRRSNMPGRHGSPCAMTE